MPPNELVRRLATETLPEVLAKAGTDGLVALAVVGSCARGEETWLDDKLLSDVDVAAVIKSGLGPKAVRRLEQAGRDIGHGFTIGCFPVYSLTRYRTLEFYGAKRDAWVYWGDADVFKRVRVDAASDVPRWEGPRLVLNRAMDFLRADAGLVDRRYATAKMYLALGEAALVLDGAYDPSYRRQQLLIESREGVLGDRELRDWFLASVEFKFDPRDPRMFTERPDAHRVRFLNGMARLFSQYLGREVEPLEGLRVLSERHRSAAHRALFLARNASRPSRWSRVVASDPVFWFWNVAVEALTGNHTYRGADLVALLADFDRTHQPLPR